MLQLNSKEKKGYRCYSYCTVFLVIVKHDFQGGEKTCNPSSQICKFQYPFKQEDFSILKEALVKTARQGQQRYPPHVPQILWKRSASICIQTCCKIEKSKRSIYWGTFGRLGPGRICLSLHSSGTLWCNGASAAGLQFLMKKWGPPTSR